MKKYGFVIAMIAVVGFQVEARQWLAEESEVGAVDLPVYKVEIGSGYDSPEESSGSAFPVGNDLYLTNYHVIRDCITGGDRPFLRVRGRRKQAEVLAIDVANDLAVLRVYGIKAKPFTISEQTPAPNSKLSVYGFPRGVALTKIEGIYQRSITFGFSKQYIVTAAMTHGMSGGPVTDKRGQVIGIIRGGYGDGANLNFVVPSIAAIKLLKIAGKREDQDTKLLLKDIATDSESIQERQTKILLEYFKPERSFLGWKVPGVPEDDSAIYCSETPRPIGDGLFCNYIGGYDYLSSGTFSFAYTIILLQDHWLQTAAVANEDANIWSDSIRARWGGDGLSYACKSNVRIKIGGVPAAVGYCLQPLKYSDHLYDAEIRFSTLSFDDPMINGALSLKGYTKQNILKLFEAFTKNVEQD